MLNAQDAVTTDEPPPIRSYIKWTPEMHERLTAAFAETGNNRDLADRLGLPHHAVSRKCAELRLLRKPLWQHPARWSIEDEGLLRVHWARGLTASQISEELGGRFSRNSIIGKADRLDLSSRTTGHRSPKQPKRPSPPRVKKPARSTPFRHKPLLYLAIDNAPDDDIPQEQRKSIMELNENTCRWPVGDPQKSDFFYCGAESAGFTYCPKHTAKAHKTFKSVGDVAARVIEKLEAQRTHDPQKN